MLKIVIFGGAGFFARSLYSELASLGIDTKIISIARSLRKSLPTFVTELCGDVTRYETLDALPDCFDGAKCLYLADSSTDKIPSEKVRFHNMILSVRNVMNFCEKRGINDFTYASSGAVYQYSEEIKSEVDDLKKTDFENYASAKIFSENYIQEVAKTLGINSKIARCFSFVGEYLPNTHFAIMNFINAAATGRDITVTGSGQEVRSYLHQRELGKSLLNLISYNHPLIVNIGSNKAINVLELAHWISDSYNVNIVGPLSSSPPDRNVYVPATDRYCSLFGALETLSLGDRIDLTYRALRKQNGF